MNNSAVRAESEACWSERLDTHFFDPTDLFLPSTVHIIVF